MSDRPKCIPPAPAPPLDSPEPWNELAAFRETALRHFSRPEDEACLRRLGELLTESALEQAHLWPAVPGSETAGGARAAHRDLLHLLHFLRSLGDGRHLSTLDPPERHLAAAASRTARRLRRAIHSLHAALDRYTAETRVL